MPSPKTKRARKRPIPLAMLRAEILKKTQVQVAERAEMFQTDVSRLERRPRLEDVAVGTVRKYVEALGGELRLVAVVDGEAYELGGAGED